MMTARVLIVALAVCAAGAFAFLGDAALSTISARTHRAVPASQEASSAPWTNANRAFGTTPSLTGSAQAAISVLRRVAELAKDVPHAVVRRALAPGIDPTSNWKSLKLLGIDLEGETGFPTQLGLVVIDEQFIGDELTLRVRPSSGELTNKAIRNRRLGHHQPVDHAPDAGTLLHRLPIIEAFANDRIPIAYSDRGDRIGIANELADIDVSRLHFANPDVEWFDTALWIKTLPEIAGLQPTLSAAYAGTRWGELTGAHVGVNDARAAARVLFSLSERKEFKRFGPKTYEDFIRYQIAIRNHGSEVQKLALQRLEELKLN